MNTKKIPNYEFYTFGHEDLICSIRSIESEWNRNQL